MSAAANNSNDPRRPNKIHRFCFSVTFCISRVPTRGALATPTNLLADDAIRT